MEKIELKCALLITFIFPFLAFAASVSDLLIMQDIGQFKFMGKGGGQGAGFIASADHFNKDHLDESYGCLYYNDPQEIGIKVEVTQHAGSDSDKWLLHEIDKASRDLYGIPAPTYAPRQINGQTIFENSVGGRKYRWLSGSKVVFIEYHGSLRTTPEPIEVVQAYLAKHPSTLPPITIQELRSAANKTTWIKDEMDRRLWLCDKWFYQLQLKKVDEKQVYQESIKSLNIFLDYREKYYGFKAADEKNLIAGYLNSNNGTGIKAKLDEYKKWWVVNKDKAISL